MAYGGWGMAVGGIALAAAVGFAGHEVSGALLDMKRAERIVTVKGLAEREVEADLAFWRIPFRGEGVDGVAAIAAAERSRQAIAGFAANGGINVGELTVEPYSLRVERMFVRNSSGIDEERVRYVAVGAIRVRSTNVDALAQLTGRTQDLLDAGVLLGENDMSGAAQAEFLFTELNAIKPALIAEATEAARSSARQFAEDSGARVGAIASANQGVIQILPRDGQYNERTERYKIVRVVGTIRYYLED